MIHLSTIQLLREWARWGQANNIDYPSLSPMFGERSLKTPLYGTGHLPDDVYRTECAVCALTWDDRALIIQRYCRHQSYSEMGRYFGVSKWSIHKRLRIAEGEVDKELRRNNVIINGLV